MKINEIITQKRKEKNLTQEKLASCLGVSTPAVNKWEKGSTYPDITLLPALARILGVDPNTLLSFNEDLSETEISCFITEVNTILIEKDYETAFQAAVDKISKYPNNVLLINSVATLLLASIAMAEESKVEGYESKIEELFERVVNSNDSVLQSQSRIMLITRYIEKKNYIKAKDLIDSLPEDTVSKNYFLAELHIMNNEYDEALKLLETKLLLNITEIQGFLLRMIQISKNTPNANLVDRYADIHDELNTLFDLNHSIVSQAKLEVAIQSKDISTCIDLLEQMMSANENMEPINSSTIFKHLDLNTLDENAIQHQQSIILEDIKKRDDTEFLKDDEKFNKLFKREH